MLLHEKIRITRLAENLSQENLASQLNISQPAYQKIECGKTCISAVNIIKLSQILNFDFVEYLKELIQEEESINCLGKKEKVVL